MAAGLDSGRMMSGRSYRGRSTGGGAAVAALDPYLQSREPAWFRTRLTLRMAMPIDPPARVAAWRLAVSAALLAPPVMVLLIAPAARLTGKTLIALCCVALPGAAALLWSAATLREERRRTVRSLRQSGAEHGDAWLIGASRLVLFTAIGAICGAVCVAVLHAPLIDQLPRRAPLHGMFSAGPMTWLLGAVQTVVIAAAAALIASAPAWQRRRRHRRKPPPTASRAAPEERD